MSNPASCYSPECDKIMKFLLELHDDTQEREYRSMIYATPLLVHNVVGHTRESIRNAIQRLLAGNYVRRYKTSGMYQTDTKLYDKYIVDSKSYVRRKPIPIRPRNQYMKVQTIVPYMEKKDEA